MEMVAIAGLMAAAVALVCMLVVVGLARSLDGKKAQQEKAAREQVSKLIARAASAGGLAGLLAQGAQKGAPSDEGGATSSQDGKSMRRFVTGLAIAGGMLMLVVGIIAGDG